MNKNLKFYAEYDEDSQMYCVFDNETGKSYYSSCSYVDAEDRADSMNDKQNGRIF